MFLNYHLCIVFIGVFYMQLAFLLFVVVDVYCSLVCPQHLGLFGSHHK